MPLIFSFFPSLDYLLYQTDIKNKYEEANIFLTELKNKLKRNGYDFDDKSAKELAEIITIAL